MIFYYSGCGDSAWAAKTLHKELGHQLVFIPHADKNAEYLLEEDEELGFVFPVYSWAPPEIVTKFIEGLRLNHAPKYCFMVCTMGDEVGLTAELLRKTLSRKGWRLDAAYSIQMPETYINLPGFKLDTPEGVKAKHEAAQLRIQHIAEALKGRATGVTDVTVGGMAWFKSVVVKWLFYKFLITDKPFRSTDACVGCGICAKNCPVGNISIKEGRPHWGRDKRCLTCMSCYHRCPQHAIHFGRQTEGKGQYFCELKATSNN